MKLPRPERSIYVPTTEEVGLVLERADAIIRPAVMLGAFAGLRHAEVTGLTVDRVDFLRRTIKVDRQWISPPAGPGYFGVPKTPASTRSVPVADGVLAELARSIERHGTGDDGRIIHARRLPLGRSAFGRRWISLGAGFRFHDLRHYFASLLIAHGRSVPAVQHALGHDNATTTLNTYAHLWPTDEEQLRAAVADELSRIVGVEDHDARTALRAED